MNEEVTANWNSREKVFSIKKKGKLAFQTTFAVLSDTTFINRGVYGTIRGKLTNEKPTIAVFTHKLEFGADGFTCNGETIEEAEKVLLYNGSSYIQM